MTDQDPELDRLLHDAVSDVEPFEGLSAIRARTKEKKMSARRPFLFGAGGAAIATAAVIGVVVWSGALGGDDPKDAGPVSSPGTPSATVADPTPTETATETSPDPEPPASSAVPVYYLGDGPKGPVLYREFQANADGIDPVASALDAAISGSPLDPDYRTSWPAGTEVQQLGLTKDLLTIGLTGDLRNRPAGMSADEAAASVEQLIYTAQAAYGEGRVPVEFRIDDEHTDMLLGVPAAEPLANAPLLDTLSHVNITSPESGETVSGKIAVTGVINNFEANVVVEVLRGDTVVATEIGMAEGYMEEKLFPFSVDVDLSGLEPGDYVLRIRTDDPSAGAEGNGIYEDTKAITID